MMITYRAPRADEAQVLAALGRDSFCQAFGHLYCAEDLGLFLAQVYSTEAVAADLVNPDRLYWVAESGAGLVGYCKIAFDASFDYDLQGKRAVELKQLYLLASAQGAGIGQHLMDWAIDQAKRVAADAVILSVWSGNTDGHRFYKRNGFDWVADTYFMVGNQRDDEYLFLKPLQD